jgi:putative glutamine amidotransferase
VAITTYVAQARWGPWDQRAALTPYGYVDAVRRAGGDAVLLPPAAGVVERILDAVAAVVVCGGPDVDPARYGAAREPATAILAPERDGPELELIEAVLREDVPLLGICRGMQLLNVARGGTLVQDLPDHVTRPGTFDSHAVQTVPGTRVAGALGATATVASGHHQGIDRLGSGLVVGARAPDGTVEAIEDPARRFAVGVLWHPEQGEDGRLFDALMHAAGNAIAGEGANFGVPVSP